MCKVTGTRVIQAAEEGKSQEIAKAERELRIAHLEQERRDMNIEIKKNCFNCAHGTYHPGVSQSSGHPPDPPEPPMIECTKRGWIMIWDHEIKERLAKNGMSTWIIDELDDGRLELTAPNGVVVMIVTKETAGMVGRLLLDSSEEDDDFDY